MRIRNALAHEPVEDMSENDTLEHLSLVSVLTRKLDHARPPE